MAPSKIGLCCRKEAGKLPQASHWIPDVTDRKDELLKISKRTPKQPGLWDAYLMLIA